MRKSRDFLRSRMRLFSKDDSNCCGEAPSFGPSGAVTQGKDVGTTDSQSSVHAAVAKDSGFDSEVDLGISNSDSPNVWGSFDSGSGAEVFGTGPANSSNATNGSGTDSGIWRRGAPVTGLLQRHSIRTKLFFGVVTLACTIVLLTIVGLVGFYRYRTLADAISTRATELSLATELSQCATAARDSNTRICLMKSREGMIDSSVLAESGLKFERTNFDNVMLDLSVAFNRYAVAVGVDCTMCECIDDHPAGAIDTASLSATVIDTREQRDSVLSIGKTLHRSDRMRQDPRAVAVYAQTGCNELSGQLDLLVTQTQEHLGLIHDQMASFSDHVKLQHRAGIAGAWIALALAALITAAMVWYFQMMVIGPFSNLVMGARLVARGQYRHRIEMGSEDEIGELGEILNQMTDRFRRSMLHIQKICKEKDEEVKVRSREVIRNEQLAGVGFLAAGFAHEINNPMAAIAWSAEALESRVNDLLMYPAEERLLDGELMETMQENLQRIQGEAYRCKSITERMLSFSRVGHVDRDSIDVAPLVSDVVEMIGTLGKYKCKKITVDAAEGVIAHANSQEIRQVILNLVTNAMESVDSDGRVDIVLRNDGMYASILVRDSGCGMTADVMQHLFEPFYTRRRDGTGTGLGLSISYRIVSQHGGQLIPRSDGEGCGSEFELRLPIRDAAKGTTEATGRVQPEREWQEASPQAA
ncbi:sensor histidine kinase [Rhodopirellula sp. SWK7]|uniref:sensor histidine kinase n=1 Tax=Rhodopirellula sp. SWK7 TaxID=595460 RepID=UPI0007C52582|nr:HAMP domain-containing sensor histidine kinase [Rhodopirellula sp. SWK7]